MNELQSGQILDQQVDDFDRKRYAIFAALIGELVKATGETEEADFARVFRHAQSVLGKTDMQMSLLFKVSRPTVGRWSRGVTAPHPMLRKAVFDVLLEESRQALKSFRQPSAA